MTTSSSGDTSASVAVEQIQESVRLSSRRTAALETDHLREKERADVRHARNMEELAAIRAMQAETARQIEETALQMKETDRCMAQQKKEADRRMAETDRLFKETALQMKETDRRMAETDRRLKKAEDLFTTQWGRLMESLVAGDLVPLLQARGIDVRKTHRRSEGRLNGEHYEFDILAVSGEEVVVVEVKTTLRPEDVTRFLTKLGRFKEWFSSYRDHRLFGAVAFLEADSNVIRQAERRGLFVIRATGSSASILNPPDFKPRVFP